MQHLLEGDQELLNDILSINLINFKTCNSIE